MKYVLLSLLFVSITAQAPSPAPVGAPLLTLDYAFKFTPAGHTTSISAVEEGVGGTRNGLPQATSNGAYLAAISGMLQVEVVGHGTDGGIVVRMLDQIDGPPQLHAPTHPLTCEIYSGGNVSCMQPPFGASFDERVLLPLLTPTFFAIDGKGPAKIIFVEQGADGIFKTQRTVTLTSSPSADANKVSYVDKESTIEKGGALSSEGLATDSILVDQSIHLPVAIDYSWQNTRPSGDAADEFRVQLSLKSVQ